MVAKKLNHIDTVKGGTAVCVHSSRLAEYKTPVTALMLTPAVRRVDPRATGRQLHFLSTNMHDQTVLARYGS